VLAPICGALRWRPHIWVSGERGSGKSWITDQVVRAILGENCLFVQGATSEAGIRQTLKLDALPVVFDEAESEGGRGAGRFAGVMELARQASSDNGAAIVKGSASGESNQFRVRSMFYFSAIHPTIVQESDQSRITLLQIKQRKGEDAQAHFDKIAETVMTLLAPEYATRFRARSFHLLPTIRKNIDTFTRAASLVLGTKRAGDQVGALLAGAYALTSDAEIKPADAMQWVKDRDWSEQIEQANAATHEACLEQVLSSLVPVRTRDNNADRRSIRQLIRAVMSVQKDSPYGDDGVYAPDAEMYLSQYGIKVRYGEPEGSGICIAKRHPQIRALLKDTNFASSYDDLLTRIEGARMATNGQMSFGTRDSKFRAVFIPIEPFLAM